MNARGTVTLTAKKLTFTICDEATRMPLWWLQPLEVALTGQNSFLETWTLRGKGGGRAAVAGEIQFGA